MTPMLCCTRANGLSGLVTLKPKSGIDYWNKYCDIFARGNSTGLLVEKAVSTHNELVILRVEVLLGKDVVKPIRGPSMKKFTSEVSEALLNTLDYFQSAGKKEKI